MTSFAPDAAGGARGMRRTKGPERRRLLEQCCGARVWVEAMMARFEGPAPPRDLDDLRRAAELCFDRLADDDWLEAFSQHPRIGDLGALRRRFSTAELAGAEQAGSAAASEKTLRDLASGNRRYEERFGYIFIVYAAGKSAEEMLDLLRSRLGNTSDEEIAIAASEQRRITGLRLETLFAQDAGGG